MRRTFKIAAVPAALLLTTSLAACGGSSDATSGDGSGGLSGTLSAGGSSAQEAAMASWRSGFQTDNPNATINYEPVGSGGGREQFISGGYPFAGTDSPLDEEELAAAKKQCGADPIEVPTYVSPIAVVYNLPGVEELNLSAETVAKIFSGEITTWDDPAIAADNDGVELPGDTITPVHRSDESGTQENFTEYLDQAGEGAWKFGETGTWPSGAKGGEGAQGTSGVIDAVKNGSGTIGFADVSQAGELGKANIKVGSEFVAPSGEAASKILDVSQPLEGRPATDMAVEIDRTTTEAGVYPLVLVSYVVACPTYKDAQTADLVKGFLDYVVSAEGQQAAAETAGSAPLSETVSGKAQELVQQIKAG